MSNLRLYSFIHFILSSIQQGIQTGHAQCELMNKYVFDDNGFKQREIVQEWSQNHKTWYALNGGNSKSLKEILDFLETNPIPIDTIPFGETFLPFAEFREDKETLEGVRTGIAIIVPEEIYDAVNYRAISNIYAGPEFFKQYPRDQHEDSWFWVDPETNVLSAVYTGDSVTGQFLSILKRAGLAR